MTSRGEEAAWLRKASPLAGVLPAREREAILRALRTSAARSSPSRDTARARPELKRAALAPCFVVVVWLWMFFGLVVGLALGATHGAAGIGAALGGSLGLVLGALLDAVRPRRY